MAESRVGAWVGDQRLLDEVILRNSECFPLAYGKQNRPHWLPLKYDEASCAAQRIRLT